MSKLIIYYVIGCISSIVVGFCLTMIIAPATLIDVSEGQISKYNYVSKVACESDSMGTMLDCGDKLYLRNDVLSPEQLIEGRIYSYKRGNDSIIHRLVSCLDNCTKLIFKGDNNKVADPIVNVSQLLGRLELVEYR